MDAKLVFEGDGMTGHLLGQLYGQLLATFVSLRVSVEGLLGEELQDGDDSLDLGFKSLARAEGDGVAALLLRFELHLSGVRVGVEEGYWVWLRGEDLPLVAEGDKNSGRVHLNVICGSVCAGSVHGQNFGGRRSY